LGRDVVAEHASNARACAHRARASEVVVSAAVKHDPRVFPMTGREMSDVVRVMTTRAIVRIIMAPASTYEKALRCVAAFELGRRANAEERKRYCAECLGEVKS
jgi:hypothetical protein